MDYIAVFNQVIILFIMILVGIYASKKDILTKDVNKKLSDLLLKITLPFLIIISFQFSFSKDALYKAGIVFLIAIAIHIVSAVISKILYRKYSFEMRSVLSFTTVFSNCAFMGYPIMEGLYPEMGIFYTSMYVVAFNLFLWSYGVILFTGKTNSSGLQNIKKAFLNPGIIAVVIGLFLFVFSIKLPEPIFKSMNMIGSMTTPLSMLITGALLANSDFKKIFSGAHLYIGTAMRLIIIPIIVFFILRIFNIEETITNVLVLVTAMPGAAATVLFAEKYNADSVLASKFVAVSTLMSMITLPGIIILISIFQ